MYSSRTNRELKTVFDLGELQTYPGNVTQDVLTGDRLATWEPCFF